MTRSWQSVRRNTEISADLVDFRADFATSVVRDGSVADIGCGPGRDAVYFRSRGLDVVGVDASWGIAERAHRDLVVMIQADMRSLPISDSSLDGIWSVASLLHVPRVDVPCDACLVRALLRPAGVLGLATSLGDGEGWEACPYDPSTQQDPRDLRRWFVHHDDQMLQRLIDDAGFDIQSIRHHVNNRHWMQVHRPAADLPRNRRSRPTFGVGHARRNRR